MTLRTDLTELLADAGIVDVDIDEAIEDGHVRSLAYRRIVSVVAASRHRDRDRAVVARILRDPEEIKSKTAVVALVDKIAMKSTDPDAFRQWSTGLMPEMGRLTEGNRAFIRQRIHDWLFYLSIEDGQVPEPAQLAEVTDWMQRKLAEGSTSLPVLALLAESGSTKKIRNVAKNRAGSRELRTN